MKTLSVLLVTSVGLCLAKPPTNPRFPDFLAPFRGMFGNPRGNQHPHPDRNAAAQSHDSAGAETGKPGSAFAGHDSENSIRPYFPSAFSLSQYEDAERRPQFQDEGRPPHQFQADGKSQHQFGPEGRPPLQFNSDGRPSQQFSPEGRPPTHFGPGGRAPHFHSDGRPPPQFSPDGRSPPLFSREGRSLNQFSSDARPPIQFSPDERLSHQFNPESRTPPQFFDEGRNQPQFQPEARSVPQFSPESPQFHRRPTRQHSSNHYNPPPQSSSSGFPSYSPQNIGDEKSTGFTDFSFNPVDFDRTSFGSESDERRPFSGGGDRSPFHPSKQIPSFGHGQGQDFPGPPPRSLPGGGEIVTLNDLQKGSSGNGEKVAYFDDVYRQLPRNFVPNNLRFQGESVRGATGTPSHSPLPSKFRPPPPNSRENSSFGESRGKEAIFKPKSQTENDVHYGKPMLMSGSSTSMPAVVKPKSKKGKSSDLMPSPSFHNPSARWDMEPIAAASRQGGGDEHFGGGGGDRILYHVAGHAGPYSYRFGYDTGAGYNRMFRHEEKDGNGLVKGKYGYHDKTGKLQVVNYSAHPTGGFQSERAH